MEGRRNLISIMYTNLKLYGKTPLDYQYTLNFFQMKGKREKHIFSGSGTNGRGWAQGKGKWWMSFVSIHDN
jgi:hypothetical protein